MSGTNISGSKGLDLVKQYMEDWGLNPGNVNTSDVASIFQNAEKNEDGSVSQENFEIAAAAYYKQDVEALENDYAEAWEAFSGADGNSSSVSYTDMSQMVSDAGSALFSDSELNYAATDGYQSIGQNNYNHAPTIPAVSLTGTESLESLRTGRTEALEALDQERAACSLSYQDSAVVAAQSNLDAAKLLYDQALADLNNDEIKNENEKTLNDLKADKSAKEEAYNNQANLVNELFSQSNTQKDLVSSLQSSLSAHESSQPSESDFQIPDPDNEGATITDTAAYNAEMQRWQEEKERLESELSNAESTVASLTAQIAEAIDAHGTLEMELKDINAQIGELSAEILANDTNNEQAKAVRDAYNAYYNAECQAGIVEQAVVEQHYANINQLEENIAAYDTAITEAEAKQAEEAQKTEETPETGTEPSVQVEEPEDVEEPSAPETESPDDNVPVNGEDSDAGDKVDWNGKLSEDSDAYEYLTNITNYANASGVDLESWESLNYLGSEVSKALNDPDVSPEEKIQFLAEVKAAVPQALEGYSSSYGTLNNDYANILKDVSESMEAGDGKYTIEDVIELDNTYREITDQTDSEEFLGYGVSASDTYIDAVVSFYKGASEEEIALLNKQFNIGPTIQQLYSLGTETEILNKLFNNIGVNAKEELEAYFEKYPADEQAWKTQYGEPGESTFKDIARAIGAGKFPNAESAKNAMLYACGGDMDKFTEYFRDLGNGFFSHDEQADLMPVIMGIFGGEYMNSEPVAEPAEADEPSQPVAPSVEDTPDDGTADVEGSGEPDASVQTGAPSDTQGASGTEDPSGIDAPNLELPDLDDETIDGYAEEIIAGNAELSDYEGYISQTSYDRLKERVEAQTDDAPDELFESPEANEYFTNITNYANASGVDLNSYESLEYLGSEVSKAMKNSDISPEEKLHFLEELKSTVPQALDGYESYYGFLNNDYADILEEVSESIQAGEGKYTIEDVIAMDNKFREITGQTDADAYLGYGVLSDTGTSPEEKYFNAIISLYKNATPEEIALLNERFDIAVTIQKVYSGDYETRLLEKLFSNIGRYAVNDLDSYLEENPYDADAWKTQYGEPGKGTFKDIIRAIAQGKFPDASSAKAALLYACDGNMSKFTEYFRDLGDGSWFSKDEQAELMPMVMNLFAGKI